MAEIAFSSNTLISQSGKATFRSAEILFITVSPPDGVNVEAVSRDNYGGGRPAADRAAASLLSLCRSSRCITQRSQITT